MIEKAAASDADLVFLDLEDSVAPSEKESARRNCVQALNDLNWGHKTRAVRINSADSEYALGDVLEIVPAAGRNLDMIIIPKVKEPRDVWLVESLLNNVERKLGRSAPIKLEVLIEEVEALVNVDAIARSSSRLEALIFGPGDFSASQGVKTRAIGGGSDYPGDIWHYARNRIVVSAKAAGLDAVDGPFADFNDAAGYERECSRACVLGMAGKWAIHPSQIAIANQVFSPTAEEIEEAETTIRAYDAALAEGKGAVSVGGRMVDVATVRIFRNVLERARMASPAGRHPVAGA
jgi:citrate lyase subunit beta/citryl-CoA lyase